MSYAGYFNYYLSTDYYQDDYFDIIASPAGFIISPTQTVNINVNTVEQANILLNSTNFISIVLYDGSTIILS